MSAFVIDDKAMQRVVRGFKKLHSDSPTYWSNKIAREIPMNEEMDWDLLGEKLFEMNVNAVNQRYGDNEKPNPFKFKEPFNSPLVWSLKAMQSLRYQCSEGNVPELPLYHLLDSACGSLAEKICRQLPEYENADWG